MCLLLKSTNFQSVKSAIFWIILKIVKSRVKQLNTPVLKKNVRKVGTLNTIHNFPVNFRHFFPLRSPCFCGEFPPFFVAWPISSPRFCHSAHFSHALMAALQAMTLQRRRPTVRCWSSSSASTISAALKGGIVTVQNAQMRRCWV